ncbi:hypothetical protein Gotri_022295, partial [Gossypium trilobum]|nr:hypothetical protein [Gossypium trilobum]
SLVGAKRETEDRIVPRSIDADDSDVEVNSDEASDDEEALLAELERIKKEKAEEKLRQLEKSAHPASVIQVKPGIRNEREVTFLILLYIYTWFRWDDDVVFKNQQLGNEVDLKMLYFFLENMMYLSPTAMAALVNILNGHSNGNDVCILDLVET